MSERIQMYIITTSCWKCSKDMNVAVINSDKKRDGFCGPEAFSEEEKKTAKKHNVIIRKQYSHTLQQNYDANTCPHCNTFIGQHYLFANYFCEGVYSKSNYIIIDLCEFH